MLTRYMSSDHGPSRWSSALGLAAWVTGLCLGLFCLLRLGGGQTTTPPVLHPVRLITWAREQTAPVAALGSLRVLAIAVGTYLLAVTCVGMVARLIGAARAVKLADAVTPRFARRIVVAGASTILSLGLPGLSASASTPAQVIVAPPSGEGPPPLHQVASPGNTALVAPVTTRGRPPPSPGPSDTPTPGPPTWTTQSGENLWSIAMSVLTRASGRPTPDSDVAGYWLSLITANRERLVDPRDPDLIYPGQVFVLPPLPDSPSSAGQ